MLIAYAGMEETARVTGLTKSFLLDLKARGKLPLNPMDSDEIDLDALKEMIGGFPKEVFLCGVCGHLFNENILKNKIRSINYWRDGDSDRIVCPHCWEGMTENVSQNALIRALYLRMDADEMEERLDGYS